MAFTLSNERQHLLNSVCVWGVGGGEGDDLKQK